MNSAELKPFADIPRSIPSRLLQPIHSPENGVQIWIVHLDSISHNEMGELTTLLDAAERTRAKQFRFERDRQHYFATRGILRGLLSDALEISASALAFEYGAHGKPEIGALNCGGDTLRFNMSHAAELAIFALAWNRNLGIDVEALEYLSDDFSDLSELATRFLSPRELAIWQALQDEATRRRALLRAWTRKEAYLKAIGEGLFDEMRTVEVALDAATPQPLLTLSSFPEDEKLKRDWIVHDLSAPTGFVAATAVEQIKPQS
jgi:4'-phosphopantetheinyl transferase